MPTGANLGYDLARLPESTGVEKLVLKRGNLFAVTNRLGDIAPLGARDQGGYFGDTRFLSGLKLTLAGGPPVCLSSQTWADSLTQVDLTVTSLSFGGVFADPVNFLHLRREQLIDAEPWGAFVDRLTLTNYLTRTLDYWLELEFACDFADQFEVRGAARARRGTYLEPQLDADAATLCYLGVDGVLYRSELTFTPRPATLDARHARFEVTLAPNASAVIELRAHPSLHLLGGQRSSRRRADEHRRPGGAALPPAIELPQDGWTSGGGAARPFEGAVAAARDEHESWANACTTFCSRDEVFDASLAQGVADLRALVIDEDGLPIISAGIPWYTAPFGRDALIAGYQALPVNPALARDTLRFLAAYQGTQVDAFREEQPGKILHELRRGELARAGEVPHTPYFGSVDATPLFVVLLGEYFQWTNDRATVEALLPAAERAMGWIEGPGDPDGDGFVEYLRSTPRGLENQGWKDSRDGVPWPDGTPAAPPIALVEVQGYCYDARVRLAELHRRLGTPDGKARSAALVATARKLARRIDEAFWVEETGAYALALDAGKRPVPTVTSNAGHLLWSRAIPEARARRLGATLLAPETFSGWGLRTLAKGQRAYNPLSYHNGTVWPHDNSLVAMGLASYGMTALAVRVFEALYAAARHFRNTRLPELFCGLGRGEGAFPVHYPVACSPQAWASGAPFLLLRAALGLFPDAPRKLLRIVDPQLPAFLDELRLNGLRVGDTRLDLRFVRSGHGCFATVERQEGPPLAVRIDVGSAR